MSDTPDAPRTGTDAVEAVRGVVVAIPPGAVLSYGDVAELAWLSTPRLAARIMAMGLAGTDIPWWRVVRADGTLWTWGRNVSGSLGRDTVSGEESTPGQVGTATNWTTVACGTMRQTAPLRTAAKP